MQGMTSNGRDLLAAALSESMPGTPADLGWVLAYASAIPRVGLRKYRPWRIKRSPPLLIPEVDRPRTIWLRSESAEVTDRHQETGYSTQSLPVIRIFQCVLEGNPDSL